MLSVFSSPFVFILNYLYQPYLKASGVNIAIFGTVFSKALLISALFQRYAYKFEKKFGIKWSVFFATIIPGILYIMMAFVYKPLLAILFFILLRGFIGLGEPLFSDYKNIHIPSRNRATVLSLISMFVSLYLIIMRFIIGKLADFNLNYSFILMGTIIIIASIALRIDEKHIINYYLDIYR